MSQRIRYEKLFGNKILQSSRVFNKMVAYIDLEKKEYSVRDASTFTIITQGTGPSALVLKRKAKEALIKLGVSFDEDERSNATPKLALEEEEEPDVVDNASKFSSYEEKREV